MTVGCWLLDLAKKVPDSVELHGVDVYGDNFPKVYPPSVHLKVNSVTKLPEEWSGRFDFVNERLLGVGIQREEWPIVLSELYRVLKPGGSIQLVDHLSDTTTVGPTYKRALELADEILSKRGLVHDCPLQLPTILKQTGFVDIIADKKHYPIGEAGGELGKLASDTVIDGFRNLMHAIKEENIEFSKKELERMLTELKKEWDGPECALGTVWIIRAKKPVQPT